MATVLQPHSKQSADQDYTFGIKRNISQLSNLKLKAEPSITAAAGKAVTFKDNNLTVE
jgi:hypothetical protein